MRFERTVALPARARPADRRPGRGARDRRRRRARPPDHRPRADRCRLRDDRRGRVPPALGMGGPATCRAAASARSRRSRRSAPPAGCRSWPISARRRRELDVVRELVEAGLGGLEVYYRSFDTATVAAVGGGRGARSVWSPPAAATTTATRARTPRRTPRLWVPPEVGQRLLDGVGRRRRRAAEPLIVDDHDAHRA